jgi:2,4-dienoyl-CoA reductase-like NADH-dependent reductase (Old Yellow Enzyme family)
MKATNQTTNCEFKRLFEPLQIKKVRIRNRIVFPACATAYATSDGFVSQGLIRFHELIASHVGLDIVEATLVRPKGGSGINQPHAYDDKYIPGLAKLAQAIKAKGATTVLQLGDMGARAGSQVGGVIEANPVAPSRITLGPREARELSVREIKEIVAAFAEGARRASEAGFDGVEFHGAHLYLIGEFLSPFANKRTDEYGGDVENRARFLLEIIKATKERVPEGFLVFCRINMFEPFEGGIEMKDVKAIAQLLEQAGIDLLDVSGICQKLPIEYEGRQWVWFTSACPRDWPEGHEIKYAAQIKKTIKIPMISVGKIFSPQLAENVLELGQSDLVAMCRALIADPDLPQKVLEGRDRDILRCKEDFRCLKSIAQLKPMGCVTNKSLPPAGVDILA